MMVEGSPYPCLHIVLARFRADADPADVEAFLEATHAAMGAAPFRVVAMGPDLQLGLSNGPCDWGYVAEVRNRDELYTWEHLDEHEALRNLMWKVRDTALNIQIPLIAGERI